MPEPVTVVMAELAGDVQEGLLAMAVGTGLQVMAAMMDADVDRGGRAEGQARSGPECGAPRPRVRLGHPRRAAGAGSPTADACRRRVRRDAGAVLRTVHPTEVLGRMAMERMLAGLSTRRYPVGLEPVGQRVEQTPRATSKSAVSRRFVATTETALAELLSRRLSELDLVALMIDGVHFGEHLCVVALGIGIDGTKHPLGLVEGSTENTTVVTDLLIGLRDRGLDTSRPIFVGIDGAKALRAAVVRVFDHPVIGRCQLHKIRNVADKLPDHLASTVTKRMRRLPRGHGAGRRSPTRGTGQRTRPHPSRCRRVVARGPRARR